MAHLSLDRQKQIDEIIETIKINTGLSYPENGLLEIAKQLDVKVFMIDFDKEELKGTEINGAIKWKDDGGAMIYINEKYPPVRKTFTLAHELGHFILHPKANKLRVDVVDYSKSESLEETEANYFAASLLVPKNKLFHLIELTKNDLNLIANYFGVSRAVIENRLNWINCNSCQD